MAYSSWGHKESDTIERLSTHRESTCPWTCSPGFGPSQVLFPDGLRSLTLYREVLGRLHCSTCGLNIVFSFQKMGSLHISLHPRANVEGCLHWLKGLRIHQAFWCQTSSCLGGLPGTQLPLCGWEQRPGSSVFEPDVSGLFAMKTKASSILQACLVKWG